MGESGSDKWGRTQSSPFKAFFKFKVQRERGEIVHGWKHKSAGGIMRHIECWDSNHGPHVHTLSPVPQLSPNSREVKNRDESMIGSAVCIPKPGAALCAQHSFE